MAGSALKVDGAATVFTVSCASPGNCGAGGQFAVKQGYGVGGQTFVVNEVNGRWGKAIEVPGTAELNVRGNAEVSSISCPGPGDCSAAGSFFTKPSPATSEGAFVVDEVNGKWGKATEVSGANSANLGFDASAYPISCASPGNCSAGGSYANSSNSGFDRVFIVNEVNGKWKKATDVAGLPTLNSTWPTTVDSISCRSPGNCSAGGSYTTAGNQEAFVVNKINGKWGKAIEVPGTAALNTSHTAVMRSVSCASPGNCSAGGSYTTAGNQEAFVVNEINGKWGKAIEVPGTAALNLTGSASVNSISCASPGNCSAGGNFTNRIPSSTTSEAFLDNEVNGKWGKAIEVPGTAEINTGDHAMVNSISCTSPGSCTAGGNFSVHLPGAGGNAPHAFLINETAGRWGKAVEAPGTEIAGTIDSVSCASPGNCSAGGNFTSHNTLQAYVDDSRS